MFDVVFVQTLHHRGIYCDVAHVKVGMSRLYARQIAMIKEIALCFKYMLSSFHSSIYIGLSMGNDELGLDGSSLESHLASATLLYSPVIFS